MAQTRDQQRASDAVASWLAAHQRNPSWLVEATGADPGTISDFLHGLRWPKLSTQGKIEAALGWPPGTIRSIGNGADAPAIPESVGDVTQSGRTSESDVLLYQRPDDISDDDWERIKRESREYIEWKIEQALGRR